MSWRFSTTNRQYVVYIVTQEQGATCMIHGVETIVAAVSLACFVVSIIVSIWGQYRLTKTATMDDVTRVSQLTQRRLLTSAIVSIIACVIALIYVIVSSA